MRRALPILLIMSLVPCQSTNAQIFTPPSAPKPRPKPAPRPAPSPQPAPVKPARQPLVRPAAPVGPPVRASVTRTLPLSAIGGMDSYIRSSLPSSLWSKEKAIIVGGWGDEYRGLVWFDVNRVPEIPGGYSAKLYLYERAPDDGSANRPTSMISYRAASPISSQTAWQNRPEVERDTEWEREVSGEGWLALDITSYIESWRAGAPNYGIVLVPRSTNNKFNFFVASDDSTRPSLHPYIRIEREVESSAVAGPQRQEPNPPLPSPVANAGPYARYSALDGTWRARLDASAGSTQIGLNLAPFSSVKAGELRGSVTLNNGRSSCSADLKLSGADKNNALHMEMLRPTSGNPCCKRWGLVVTEMGNQILVEWFDQNTGRRDMNILFSKL